MSANTSDKITDTRNAARPNSARVNNSRSVGGTTLNCDSLAGWPTASKVHFVTYQIDSNSVPIAGTQLDCRGIVSGNDIGSFVVLDGTDGGNSVNDVVEMLPTSSWGQDLSDALMAEHSRTGTHAAVTATSISNAGTLTQTGASTFTAEATFNGGTALPAGDIATADIAADAVTDAKLVYGKLRSRQGGSATNWQTTGTTTYDYSATNTFMQSGSVTCDSGGVTVTFPTAFAQIPHVFGTTSSATTVNSITVVKSITATNFVIYQIKTDGTGATTETANWLAIGQ